MLADLSVLPQGTVGVAVSGGVDSMCLLHDLVLSGVPLVVLTLDHGIRGNESAQDQALVQRYAARLGVPCIAEQADVPAYCALHKVGLEEGARAVRYAFFDRMLSQGKVACVATAHQADDLAETVLLNILRGTGLRGLCGINRREGYVHPLLGATRQQILAYAAQNEVPYREDSSNEDVRFSRNFIRQEVLPLVASRYPDCAQKLRRLAATAAEQTQALDELAVAPQCEQGRVVLPLAALDRPAALAKWSLLSALRYFEGGVDMESRHLAPLLALRTAPNNTTLDLPRGVKAAKEYDRIVFWRPVVETVAYPFGEGKFVFGDRTFAVRPYREGDRLRFDADKVPPGACIRLRQDGDLIAKFGGGTKALGDYYTDKKLPLRLRDETPVLADGHRVLACCVDISADVAVDDTTCRIFTFEEDNQ